MNTHEYNYHDDAKKAEWDLGQEAMKNLYDIGAQEFLAKAIADAGGREKVFEEKKKCVCCMDEGTANMEMKGKYALAGSGILYPIADPKQRLEAVAALLLRLEIEEVTSHAGCGAAKIACKRDGIVTDNPDAYGRKWVENLQQKMNEMLAGQRIVTSKHIEAAEMKRGDYHNARTVWFDATGKFNPAALGDKISNGFVIDCKHDTEKISPEYPFEELQVAINIAFGGHGFETKFNKDNPFVLVVVAPDQEQLERVKKSVEDFVAGLDVPQEIKEAIKIDGFSLEAVQKMEEAA